MSEYKNGDTASWNRDQVRREDQARREQQHSRKTKSTARKRRRRSRIWWVINPILYILFVGIASALLASAGWMLMSDLCAFNKPYIKTTVEVTAEDTVKTVSEKLENAGLIEYPWFFRLFGRFADAEEKIGMGTHELTTEMDYRALIVGMRSSASLTAETVTVTIPEGYTVKQIIRLLAENNVNTEEELTEVAQTYDFDYTFIDNESEDISRLEGYLFPDTYEFYVDGSPSEALDKLISTFNARLDDDLLAQAEERGYDLHEIITIASLIEKETDGTDHGKIASVIYNRLDGPGDKAGTYGLLQIDAALLYILPEGNTGITNLDKELDSPYNLYKYSGLPPTPIANPGLKSIGAALEPEDTDDYYYALATDGKHRFFTNFPDHNAFVNSSEYGG